MDGVGGRGRGAHTLPFARVSVFLLGYIPGHCSKMEFSPPQKRKYLKQKSGTDFSLVAFRQEIRVKNVKEIVRTKTKQRQR
jgi:hypothetical protein